MVKVIGPQVICSNFIEKEGKFIIFMCPRFKVWRVPGGRTEFNETVEETVVREMEEEIGVKVKNPKFLGYGQDHQFHVRAQRETSRLLMFFHVKINEKVTVDADEADEFKWVTFKEIKQIENKESGLTDFFNKNPNLKL